MANQDKRTTRAEIKKSLRQLAERASQSNLRSTREQIVFLFFLITFILVSIQLDRGSMVPYIGDSTPMNANWTTGGAEIVDLYDLPLGNLDLTTVVSGVDVNGKSLCLKSIDTVFDVYADGRLIYSYRPTIPKRLGASYGMYVHTIPLPEDTAVLGLRLEPVFPGAPAALNDVVIEEGSQYMSDLFRNNLWAFARSSVILLIGMLSLIIGVFGRILMNTAGLDFVSFGLLCALIGFTGYNDTLLLQVLTRHPAIIRVITYVCLICLP